MACGAKKSAKQGGGFCKRKNGWGTDHPGTGRCKSHGGASHGRPIIHGRYATIKGERLQQLIAERSAEEDPLNLIPDLHLLRTLLCDYIERYHEFTSALIAWHESFQDPEKSAVSKPMRVIDISAAGGFVVQVGKLVTIIEKQKSEGAISMATLDDVMQQMGSALVQAAQETIESDDARTKLLNLVESRWGNIRIDPKSGGVRA